MNTRLHVGEYLDAAGAAAHYPGLTYHVEVGTDRVVVHVTSPLHLPIAPPGHDRTPMISGTAAAIVLVSR